MGIDGGAEKLSDYLQTEKSPEDLFADTEFAEYADSVIKTFPPEEEKVLRLRFYGDKEMTQKEVGKVLGITRNTVRGIEVKALTRLRLPSRLGSRLQLPNDTVLPETLKLVIKDKDGPVAVEVSKKQFETIVMKIFDEKITTPGKIADELGCKALFVSYVVNEKLAERARKAKTEAVERRHQGQAPDTQKTA